MGITLRCFRMVTGKFRKNCFMLHCMGSIIKINDNKHLQCSLYTNNGFKLNSWGHGKLQMSFGFFLATWHIPFFCFGFYITPLWMHYSAFKLDLDERTKKKKDREKL